MSEINQMALSRLLQAMSTSSSLNNINNSSSDFLDILSNSLLGYDYSNNSCKSCGNTSSLYSSDLTSLNTLVGSINSNRINLEVDSTSEVKMSKAIDLLKEQVGKKYVWGASGPDNFDCSGLTKYIYKEALGKDIPRTSYEQSDYGKSVNKEDLNVGDLVFFDTMNKGTVSHVGIYVGDNQFIHASNSTDGVKVSTLSGYYEKTYVCARRP